MKVGDRAGNDDDVYVWHRTGFLGVLAPSESIEDRTVVGPADHV